MSQQEPGMIKLVGIWKELSSKGEPYYSGTIRPGLKLLVFRNNKKKPGDNQPDFQVFLKQYDSQSKNEEPQEGDSEL